ncbi:MAG TPA: hypothetical protein VN937_01020, partial [Blastocatellia bacterium]|nr:hypothetical protein [Blastocatellia bacterium]
MTRPPAWRLDFRDVRRALSMDSEGSEQHRRKKRSCAKKRFHMPAVYTATLILEVQTLATAGLDGRCAQVTEP